jgi:drug/metabolite transporter (DMT)-like permease
MSVPAPSRSTERRAILALLAALGCLILLDVCGKWLGRAGVPVAATTWSRYAGHLVVVLAIFLPTRGLAALRTAHPGRQALRGTLMVAVTLLDFAALQSMPLAQATAVFFTTPVLVTVFAAVFLRERPGWATWAAVATGFAGVLVVVRPGTSLPLAGVLLVLAAAAGNAAYQTLTRAQAQADSPAVQVLWSGLVGATIMTATAPLWWSASAWPETPPTSFDWAVFAAIGPLGAAGHLLLARAYRLAQASRLAPWAYTQMLLSIALGWAVFGDVPDAVALVGMAMIAASPQVARLGGLGRRSRAA